ncbi:MAG: hypothetical protein JKY94_00915 [Rhodobacteraceae bacterium]|nr:hypothetical protein [Paracoccaceae bacterium]
MPASQSPFYSNPQIAAAVGNLGSAIFGNNDPRSRSLEADARYNQTRSDVLRSQQNSRDSIAGLFSSKPGTEALGLDPVTKAQRAAGLQAAAGDNVSETLLRSGFLGQDENALFNLDATFGGADVNSVFGPESLAAHPQTQARLAQAFANNALGGLRVAETGTEDARRGPEVDLLEAQTGLANARSVFNLGRAANGSGRPPATVGPGAVSALENGFTALAEAADAEGFDAGVKEALMMRAAEIFQSTRNLVSAQQQAWNELIGNEPMVTVPWFGDDTIGLKPAAAPTSSGDLSHLEGQTIVQDGVAYLITNGRAVPQS